MAHRLRLHETTDTPLPTSPGMAILRRLITSGTISQDVWNSISRSEREELSETRELGVILEQLTIRRLLTPFQAKYIRETRSPAGLVFGNYRILEKLSSLRNTYQAEHRSLKTPASIRTIPSSDNRESLVRYFEEIRVLKSLRHASLLSIFDAGEELAAGPGGGPLTYVVMEPLVGRNLADTIKQLGPMPMARICQIIYQLTDILIETHRSGIVHRRISPDTIFLGADGRVRLLDFGISSISKVDSNSRRYLAPELMSNPELCDPRSDLYSLAVVLLFALSGNSRFETTNELLPCDLVELVNRLTNHNPSDRPPSASALARALTPFLGLPDTHCNDTSLALVTTRRQSLLIVDDEPHARQLVKLALDTFPIDIDEAVDGLEALARVSQRHYDVILLDLDLPQLNGDEVLKRLGAYSEQAHQKIIVISGRGNTDYLSDSIFSGADDFIAKPFGIHQLRARVTAALRLKEAQNRSDQLTQRLATCNTDLELALNARDGELVQARGALVLALAKLVEQRSSETGPHLIRLQKYCRVLGEAAADTPRFAGRLSPELLQMIEQAAPLHDIGKVAIADRILNKPSNLTHEERMIMQSHATAGADTLQGVSSRYCFATPFFHTAIDIARYHHERWDGSGYPSRLAGEAIPLAARLVAIGDVYDALRSRRIYKPALDHVTTIDRMKNQSNGHFDPHLFEIFLEVHDLFEQVFAENSD